VSSRATKNVAELLAQDSEDESLRKYKVKRAPERSVYALPILRIYMQESLLGAAAHGDLGDPTDPRRLIVTEFRVIFEEGGSCSCV
jgi:hypothetical protein